MPKPKLPKVRVRATLRLKTRQIVETQIEAGLARTAQILDGLDLPLSEDAPARLRAALVTSGTREVMCALDEVVDYR